MTEQTTAAAFRIAVKKNVNRERRKEAINTLIAAGASENLAVIVQMEGLRGTYRRQALEGLRKDSGSKQLVKLAKSRSLDEALRRQADELA